MEDVVVVAGGGVNTGVVVLDALEVEVELELELVAALVVAEILLEDVVTATGVEEDGCEETTLVMTEL